MLFIELTEYDVEPETNPNLTFGRLFVDVALLINPTHNMRCCIFLCSYTAETNMVLDKWFLDTPFIHALDSAHAKYHYF